MAESVFRIVSLTLFIIGFVSGIASASKNTIPKATQFLTNSETSILEDVRFAEEVNALNEGRWNLDIHLLNQDGLAQAKEVLEQPAIAESLSITAQNKVVE